MKQAQYTLRNQENGESPLRYYTMNQERQKAWRKWFKDKVALKLILRRNRAFELIYSFEAAFGNAAPQGKVEAGSDAFATALTNKIATKQVAFIQTKLQPERQKSLYSNPRQSQ